MRLRVSSPSSGSVKHQGGAKTGRSGSPFRSPLEHAWRPIIPDPEKDFENMPIIILIATILLPPLGVALKHGLTVISGSTSFSPSSFSFPA
nr:hypothetical protein [Pseudopontixanthobacter vadosimaris]